MNSIDYNLIDNILDKYIEKLNSLNIFNVNANTLYKNKHNIIESILNNIQWKKTLSGITNFLHPSETQFNNIAGFDPVYNNAGQLHSNFIPPKKPTQNFKIIYKELGMNELEIKENWHYDMLFILYKLFHINNNADITITSMNEEWHDYIPQQGDEFVTLVKNKNKHNKDKITKKNTKLKKIKFLGSVIKPLSDSNECSKENLSFLIRHRIYHIDNKLIIVNIHTASNINGEVAADNIIKLLKNIQNKYKKYTIILGGDSNIYYGKVDKFGNGGVDDINYLNKKLKKMNYKLIISKHIVAKYRPYNFFQNAQSGTKGGSWTNEETMLITYPKNLEITYDKNNYFELSNDIKITDFYKNYAYGFMGTKINKRYNRQQHLNKITSNNYFNKLYSDHIPIYIDFKINKVNYRIIYSNNLSINTSRGINNNMDNFKIKNTTILEKLSQNEIANFFIDELETIYKKLNISFEQKNDKLVYLKYLLLLNLNNINVKVKTKTKKKINNKTKKTKKTLFQQKWNNKNNCVTLDK